MSNSHEGSIQHQETTSSEMTKQKGQGEGELYMVHHRFCEVTQNNQTVVTKYGGVLAEENRSK